MGKKGQQEIAGFVIIVVMVVVGLLIFLVMSAKNKEVKDTSELVTSLLISMLKHTTECVIREPNPANIGELMEKAYTESPSCLNTKQDSRAYLVETLEELMEGVLAGESRINAYQMEIKDKEEEPIVRISKGSCKGRMAKGESVGLGDLKVEMIACLNADY